MFKHTHFIAIKDYLELLNMDPRYADSFEVKHSSTHNTMERHNSFQNRPSPLSESFCSRCSNPSNTSTHKPISQTQIDPIHRYHSHTTDIPPTNSHVTRESLRTAQLLSDNGPTIQPERISQSRISNPVIEDPKFISSNTSSQTIHNSTYQQRYPLESSQELPKGAELLPGNGPKTPRGSLYLFQRGQAASRIANPDDIIRNNTQHCSCCEHKNTSPTTDQINHNDLVNGRPQVYDDEQDLRLTNWFPRVLVIGPGGFKGLKALGFLSPIEDFGLLQYTDTYCGVSVGAIISLLIVAGYQIREIVGEAATLDIFKDMENISVKSIMDNKGLLSNEPVKRRLTQLVLNKFGTVPTLRGLYLQTGKAFVAVTLNATDEECEIMGPFTHPNVSCVDATMFSMNIPFVFYQLIYHGKTYADGALGNPYPIDYFDDGHTNILGIYMKGANSTPNLSHNRNAMSIHPPSGTILHRVEPVRPVSESEGSIPIGTYFSKIIHSLMDQRRNNIIQNSSQRCKHVCLETKVVNVVDYNLSTDDKAHMLVEGFNEGKSFLSQLCDNTYLGPKIPPKLSYTYPEYYMISTEDTTENVVYNTATNDRTHQDTLTEINILSAMTQ